MQVSVTTIRSNTDTINFMMPSSQVAMLVKKGDNIVDQVGKSYLMNDLML